VVLLGLLLLLPLVLELELLASWQGQLRPSQDQAPPLA
jgi:hypothetical protein